MRTPRGNTLKTPHMLLTVVKAVAMAVRTVIKMSITFFQTLFLPSDMTLKFN